LEGLEATEVNLNYALAKNDIFRIDSSYFQKIFLQEESVLREKGSKRLYELGASVKSFGAYSLNNVVDYLDAGVPFIRGVNMKNGRVSFTDMLFISKEAHELLWKSEVKEGMVLLSMSGTIGDVAIATTHWPYPINSNQDIAKIDVQGVANPFVLYAYLLSRFGQNYLRREARGSVQQHVFLSQIEQLEVPKFGAALEVAIQRVLEDSECRFLTADQYIKASESKLLSTLGLDTWTPPEALSYERSSREAFAAGRFDAEYFQPKYEEMISIVKKNRDDYELVQMGELSQPLKYGCSDKLDYIEEGRAFLRIADLENKRFNEKAVLRVSSGIEFSPSELVAKDDVLISRSGTLGIAVPIGEELDGSSYGSYFIRSRPDTNRILPEYLSLAINSLFGKMQVEQMNTGGIQTNLTIPAIESILIPVGNICWQQKFVDMVIDSLMQRERAGELLTAAKCAVEIAIEDSEAAALDWLQTACLPSTS